MKSKVLPTKPKPVPFKALYEVKHYIRVYQDINHPESYEDYPIKTRTSRPHILENLNAQGYQFFDELEVSYSGVDIDSTKTLPRNFSKLRIVTEAVEEAED
jgi:ABC-type microcin C transport system permease subunit YejE